MQKVECKSARVDFPLFVDRKTVDFNLKLKLDITQKYRPYHTCKQNGIMSADTESLDPSSPAFTPAGNEEKALALFDFEARNAKELAFRRGDLLDILKKSET